MKKILTLILLICGGFLSAQTYRIGDLYTAPDSSKGIVYYLHPDGSGGWVVALTDASAGCSWGDASDVPGITNQSLTYVQNLMTDTAGYTNTQTLRMYQNNNSYAAGVVDFANGWVLPSPAQLRMLFGKLPFISTAITNAGGATLAYDYYWCSAEYSSSNAWILDFGGNFNILDHSGRFDILSKNTACHVRAVRSFSTPVINDTLTYLWNTGSVQSHIDVMPSQTTNYTVTVTSSYGCSNTANQNIIVETGIAKTIYDTICQGFIYEANDFVLTAEETGYSGSLIRTRVVPGERCDSTITLQLFVSPIDSTSFSQTACNSFLWNDVTYVESGDYYQHFDNRLGCDSVVTLHLIVNPSINNLYDTTVCENYTWNGVTYTSSGTYTYNYTNVGGCVSTDTLYLTVNTPMHESETVSAYDTYIWHGETYNQTGNYIYNHTDANGCNQADTLHLTLHYSSSGEFSVVSCDSYTWNDSTYTTSGDYVQRFQDINGADSIMTLHLAIYHGTHNILDTSVCESYTWVHGNGETYTTSGIYIYEYTNIDGCASTDTLLLTLNPVFEVSFEDVVCEGFAYYNHGFNIPSNETIGVTDLNFTQSLQSQSECDSIVTLHLTIVDTSIAIYPLTSDFCEEYYAELSVETNMMDYVWNTGESSQTIIATQPGIYTVTATQGNCSVSAWYQIETCELNIYLPNTITPGNEDGLNDYFGLHDKYKAMIEDFEIRIYSRWGELVYYSNDKNFKWYGEYHGRINQNVIYTYLINFTDSRGIPYQLTGSITVL